ETAMRDFGWDEKNVLGGVIVRSAQQRHKVVGVVKDFHYTSAKDKIAPLMIYYRGYSPETLVKVNTRELPALIDDLKKNWVAFNPDVPFSYYFVDDKFARLYHVEQTTEKIFVAFMIVGLLIAMLGLYGLSAYSAERRAKEIGIRKVMGAGVQQLVFMQ